MKFGRSVELQKQGISTAGAMPGVVIADGTFSETTNAKTVWSMGDSKAAASGAWAGTVYGDGTAVPSAASGAFTSEYGNVGNMVGAFGAEIDN